MTVSCFLQLWAAIHGFSPQELLPGLLEYPHGMTGGFPETGNPKVKEAGGSYPFCELALAVVSASFQAHH